VTYPFDNLQYSQQRNTRSIRVSSKCTVLHQHQVGQYAFIGTHDQKSPSSLVASIVPQRRNFTCGPVRHRHTDPCAICQIESLASSPCGIGPRMTTRHRHNSSQRCRRNYRYQVSVL
jgi:hypothetical protein